MTKAHNAFIINALKDSRLKQFLSQFTKMNSYGNYFNIVISCYEGLTKCDRNFLVLYILIWRGSVVVKPVCY
jgi:hypothetical protein